MIPLSRIEVSITTVGPSIVLPGKVSHASLEAVATRRSQRRPDFWLLACHYVEDSFMVDVFSVMSRMSGSPFVSAGSIPWHSDSRIAGFLGVCLRCQRLGVGCRSHLLGQVGWAVLLTNQRTSRVSI